MINDYKRLLPTLVKGQVKFVIIGGVAAVVHGSARITFDMDVVYARDSDNIERLVQTLKPFSPYLRANSFLPRWDFFERALTASA